MNDCSDPERSQASFEADDHSMRDAMFSQW